MRIVQYHPRALVGDGGITNSVRRLTAALVRLGADPVVLADEGGPPPPDDGATWSTLPHRGPGPLRAPVGMVRALQGADLLVCNSAWTLANVVAGREARRAGVPYVLAPRGAYDPLIRQRRRVAKSIWWATVERRLVMGASAIHVFFPSQADHVRDLGYHGPLLVAPNGVDVPPDVRWDGGSGGYLLYVGRFDPEHKGLDLLVRAIARSDPTVVPPLRLHGPDWRGGKQRVRDLVHELGVQDRVHVGEPVYGQEKWARFTAATGFVYPSRWEGFGNATAEAAALGVPTLVTPYPLGRHLADRGGAVLAEATVEGLVAGLARLCHPDAAVVGTRAAEVVTAELTWDAVAARWLQQATALVGRPSRDEHPQ